MKNPETTQLILGREDLHRVLARLSQCEFLNDFKKTGRARYVANAMDGIQHGVDFLIDRRHSIALFITPVLTIDHKLARQVRNAGIGGQRSKREEEFALLGTPLGEISKNSMKVNGEYCLVPSALKETSSEHDIFPSGSFWRSMDELEDLAQRINSDLESGGPEFFRGRDRIPQVVEWLKSDPRAGGTASRIIAVSLLYVQGQHDEILRTVNSWTKNTASPMELGFAKFISDLIGQ